jgi:hypothetical protein
MIDHAVGCELAVSARGCLATSATPKQALVGSRSDESTVIPGKGPNNSRSVVYAVGFGCVLLCSQDHAPLSSQIDTVSLPRALQRHRRGTTHNCATGGPFVVGSIRLG